MIRSSGLQEAGTGLQPEGGKPASCAAAQVKKEFLEIVLSARRDDFYRRNMYANFGDIGVAVKVS